jgi:hypothetical protein
LFLIALAGPCLLAFLSLDSDLLARLTKGLGEFNARQQQVKVHLTFNQSVYAPGDTAWFSAYFLRANDLGPVGGRQILNLELSDSSGRIVARSLFAVQAGRGASQFAFPPDFAPGIYHVSCFSDWMRNFSPDLYYHQNIRVTGPARLESVAPANYRLDFYAEGGHLAAGVLNTVIVRRSGGRGQAGTGVIEDDAGSEVGRYVWNEAGLGSFALAPVEGRRYFSKYNTSSGPVRVSLPPVERDACALTLQEGSDGLRLVLRTSAQSRLRTEPVLLVIQSRNSIAFSAEETFTGEGLLSLDVPVGELPHGITQVAAFDKRGKEIAQRLIYVPASKKQETSITLSQNRFKTRERAAAEIRLSGLARKASASVTVVHRPASPAGTIADLESQLFLQADLGVGELPSNAHDLDLLLGTVSWKRFSWEALLSGPVNTPVHPFRTYQQVSGVAAGVTGRPLPPATHMMVFLQKKMMGYDVYVKENGAFEIPVLFDFYGRDDLFLLAKENGKELPEVRVRIITDSMSAYQSPRVSALRERDEYGLAAFQKYLIAKSYGFFSVQQSAAGKDENPNADFEDELSEADVSVNVEDYIVFPTMEDLIREVVPSVQHRVLGGQTVVRVLLSTPQLVYSGDPLYIIDGAMTKDTKFFLGLKPADLLTVKVVKEVTKLARFGTLGQNGIILVQTKKANLAPELLRKGTVSVYGLTRSLPFTAMDYGKAAGRERVPDFRSTIFWEPNLVFGEDGKASVSFYTGDATGRFVVVVEGITTDGRPIRAMSEFDVEYPSN